jgi:hypothetical protein
MVAAPLAPLTRNHIVGLVATGEREAVFGGTADDELISRRECRKTVFPEARLELREPFR